MKKNIKYFMLIATALIVHSSLALSDSANKAGQIEDISVLTSPSVKSGEIEIENVKYEYESISGGLELLQEDPAEGNIEIFYVAYFKKEKLKKTNRPITFIYNGGPGSASIWLHMGALGPKRVVTRKPKEKQVSPYTLIDNKYSLLDVSDLVFIDAPSTGYSTFLSAAETYQERTEQKMTMASSVFGVNGDTKVFNKFIMQFLTEYKRWSSPKYLFGESYGTTRSVMLADELKNNNVDLSGVILVSPFLNYSNNSDNPEVNPGYDLPYILALPTYTASAWYHKKIPNSQEDLSKLLEESERFSTSGYAQALIAGSKLSDEQRDIIANRLYQLTGISAEQWIRNNLRLNGPTFAAKILEQNNQTIGRIDSRYEGSSLESLSKVAQYDPSVTVISSPYLAAFHDYASSHLGLNYNKEYKVFSDIIEYWNMSTNDRNRSFNVLPNLANIIKYSPDIKVLIMSGIYDLATPYFSAKYDIEHLSLSAKERSQIRFEKYETGHMPYIDEISLKKMHNDLKDFYKNN
ncbi:S10 family peptidase [Serratia nematodiphila]